MCLTQLYVVALSCIPNLPISRCHPKILLAMGNMIVNTVHIDLNKENLQELLWTYGFSTTSQGKPLMVVDGVLSDGGLWESSTSLLHLWKGWHSSLFCPSKTVTGQGNTDGEKEAGTYQDQVQKMESSHSHSSTDDSGGYCSWLHVKLNPHRKQRRDAGVTPKSLKLAAGDEGGSCF